MLDYTAPRLLHEYMVGDRMTPDPDGREGVLLWDIQSTNKKGWDTELRRFCRSGMSNTYEVEDFSFAAHQQYVDDYGLPEIGAPPSRPGPSIRIAPDKPQVIHGWDESVGYFYIPRLVHGVSLANMNGQTDDYVKVQVPKLPPGKQKRKPVKCRHSTDIKRYDMGPWLSDHYGLWHGTGHGICCTYGPTRDTTTSRTNGQWGSRIQWFDAMHPIDGRVNYFTWLMRPDMHRVLSAARPMYRSNPGFFPFDSVWHSLYPGRALLVNQQSGQHLDRQGVRRAWDVLVAAGDFKGGEIYFADTNIFIPFMPGDMVAFDGTSQRHEIRPFSGERRVSHVYFVHRSVLNELGVPARFEDVYLSDLRERLAAFNRPPPRHRSPPPPGSESTLGKRKEGSCSGSQSKRPKAS